MRIISFIKATKTKAIEILLLTITVNLIYIGGIYASFFFTCMYLNIGKAMVSYINSFCYLLGLEYNCVKDVS